MKLGPVTWRTFWNSPVFVFSTFLVTSKGGVHFGDEEEEKKLEELKAEFGPLRELVKDSINRARIVG